MSVERIVVLHWTANRFFRMKEIEQTSKAPGTNDVGWDANDVMYSISVRKKYRENIRVCSQSQISWDLLDESQ